MSQFYKEDVTVQLTEYGIEFFLQKRLGVDIMSRAHIHPTIEFIYVTRGIFEIGIDGYSITANEGDLVLLRANAIHTIRHAETREGSYYILKIDPSLLFHVFSGEDNLSCILPFIQKNYGDVSHFTADSIPPESQKILNDMIDEYARNDRFFLTALKSLATRFLVSLLRDVISPYSSIECAGDISKKNVELIYNSVRYINENYASDITPAMCAASINLSYSYFAKLFRAIMGKTFKEYLTEVRLAKAHNILIYTDLSITDVATACGYGNLSYFISEYGRVYGKTPRDTRKELSLK